MCWQAGVFGLNKVWSADTCRAVVAKVSDGGAPADSVAVEKLAAWFAAAEKNGEMAEVRRRLFHLVTWCANDRLAARPAAGCRLCPRRTCWPSSRSRRSSSAPTFSAGSTPPLPATARRPQARTPSTRTGSSESGRPTHDGGQIWRWRRSGLGCTRARRRMDALAAPTFLLAPGWGGCRLIPAKRLRHAPIRTSAILDTRQLGRAGSRLGGSHEAPVADSRPQQLARRQWPAAPAILKRWLYYSHFPVFITFRSYNCRSFDPEV